MRKYSKLPMLAGSNQWLIDFPPILMKIIIGLFKAINVVAAKLEDREGGIVLELLTKLLTRIHNCDRASIYMVDHIHQELSTRLFQNKMTIQLPIGKGVAGKCALDNQAINIK